MLLHYQETHNNEKNDQLRTRRMFKEEETTLLNWHRRYLIDLKNEKGEGKTTRLITKKKKVRSKVRAMTKHSQSPQQLGHGGNKKRKKNRGGEVHLL
jgi:hypothetical protein